MCASPQATCGGTCKLRWGSGQATGPRAVWMATVCNSGLSRGVGLLPGSLPFWPRPRAVARWPSPPCAQLQLSARQPQPNRRQAALGTQCFAGVYAEGPAPAAASASHRERSRSAGVPCFELISPSSSSALPLGKRRSVCSLSEVACRMELSCAPKARIHVLQAPALMTTSLTPQGSERLCLALRQPPPCVCVTAAASLVSSHLEECHIYI